MHPVEIYLADLRDNRNLGAGTAETSNYGTLQNLLKAVGEGLTPKVVPISQLKDQGAGLPDFGLFTQDQIPKKGPQPEMAQGQLPARGVIEVKAVKDDSWVTAEGVQVSKYWGKYGQVLVTNYRDFVFIGPDGEGHPRKLETFRLADTEIAFWSLANHPRKAAAERGDALMQFLERCMLQGAPLADPKALAALLAAYAWEAKERVDRSAHLPALDALQASFEKALGISFDKGKGRAFFHSSLVQTLFYGVFSAWVAWCGEDPEGGRFRWKEAAWTLHVPMVKALFGQLAQPSQLKSLGLVEVLDWAEDALNRVDRPIFFARFENDQAIQYFYEPFLEAFDPGLRKQMGVWYTPREVVRYMVARVDQALRDELGLAEGLAHPSVHILDPCCGTGAFLVEVLRKVHENLSAGGTDATTPLKLKEALLKRVHGFELLPAPFVVAHLQMGLELHRQGAALKETERLGVYLTNALTGWEPPKGPKAAVLMPELMAEKEVADAIKREAPILVILGNPPYDGFSGIAGGDEERRLSLDYRIVKKVAPPRGQGLNDPYVRFFRMAERKIADWTKKGVVCFISNNIWLDGLSHTGMRERMLEQFDLVRVDNLNGDKFRTGKLTPAGDPDPSIFSTPSNRVGIQPGTAITLLLRKKEHGACKGVEYRDLWGKDKLTALQAQAIPALPEDYTAFAPELALGLPFKPLSVSAAYLAWKPLPDLFPAYYPGVKTSRDEFLVDTDRERLEGRLARYFDASISNDALRGAFPDIMTEASGFAASSVRDRLRKKGPSAVSICSFAYRPMDVRWLAWESTEGLLDRARPEYFEQAAIDHCAFAVPLRARREWSPPLSVKSLADINSMDGSATVFLAQTREDQGQHGYSIPLANLTLEAQVHLEQLGADPTDLFFHTLAILHAPAYQEENQDALRQDWPRLPLPETKALLESSAALGRRLSVLLDVEQPVDLKDFKSIGNLAVSHPPVDPARHFLVRAGWGFRGKDGICMLGKGRREGERVFLNDEAWWEGIPDAVWEYSLGGYPVLKKWLSYREEVLLGRPLTLDEVEHFKGMARRIAAILTMGHDLDRNYIAFK